MEKLEYAGPYIYYVCQIRKLSLSAVCSYASISYIELNNIYNGKFEPHPNTLKRICDFVGIDFIALFKKQEKYEKLLSDAFHTLTYDIIPEQKTLMDKVEKIDFEHSILFPEYLLLKAIYIGMNDPASDEFGELLQKLEMFVNVFCDDYKGLYYIYKGVYHRRRYEIDEAEKYYRIAEKISPFSYSELLYQHYAYLCYMQNRYLETLDYNHRAYALYEKKWNINRLLSTKVSIGGCYIAMRRYDLADIQLKKTLSLGLQYKNDHVICCCYSNLAYNHLLMRDYEACINFAMKAINVGSPSPFIAFYLAYSYTSLESYGEAALWVGKREQMKEDSLEYMSLIYVKKFLDRLEDTVFMKSFYDRLENSDIKEVKVLVLEDVASIYHERESLEDENRVLKEIIDIIR